MRATNIKRGTITADGMIFCRLDDLPLERAPLLAEGEILVVRSGAYTGDSAKVTKEWAGSAPGYDLRLTPTRIHPAYLAYCLLSMPFLEQIDIAKSRAAQPHLNAEDLGEVSVNVPQWDDQVRIAHFLDSEIHKVDQLTNATNRQSEVLEARLLEFLRWMTTRGREAELRDSGVPWMPSIARPWGLPKVGQKFLTGSGTTPPSDQKGYFDGDQHWVTSTDVKNDEILTTARRLTNKALRDIPTLSVHPAGAVVVAMYGAGATKGRVGLLRIAACVNQACCVLHPTGQILSEFAFYWLRAHKEGIVRLANGAGQPNLSQGILRDLRIPMPTVDDQRMLVKDIRHEEVAHQRRIGLLKLRQDLLYQRKRSLITAAVTGQVDIATVRSAEMS